MGTRWVLYESTLDTEVDPAPLLDHLAMDVESAMRSIVPVDTGALKAGIYADPADRTSVRIYSGRHVTRLTKSRGSGDVHAADDPKVPLYVEQGTRHMRAQPYMRPALYRYRDGAGVTL